MGRSHHCREKMSGMRCPETATHRVPRAVTWLLPGQGQANAIVSKPGDKRRQSVKSWREGLLPALVSYRGSCVGEGSLHKHRVC